MAAKHPIYRNLAALDPIKSILADASKALDEPSRRIETSDIPQVLGGIAGSAVGVGVGLALVNTVGVAGFSAAGITSGLATLGVVAGGGMLAGIFVAGAPMAVLGVAGYAILAERNNRKLIHAKETLFQEAVRKQDAILRELNAKVVRSDERNRYLDVLNIHLQRVIDNLKADLTK